MKSFKTLIETAKQRNSYWFETAKLDFSIELNRMFKRSGMSQVEFASKIDSSPAYVTKVFRGDTNFTIETMVKLASAVDGDLHIQITPKNIKTKWFKELTSKGSEQPNMDETAKQWAHLTKKPYETNSSLA
ncbi:MAG: helix-turn-helix transcriptional regulator [Methylococcales bacterium]|nr:helix-turn-helix transcriptional regulator [Methylococcales bacterium]